MVANAYLLQADLEKVVIERTSSSQHFDKDIGIRHGRCRGEK